MIPREFSYIQKSWRACLDYWAVWETGGQDLLWEFLQCGPDSQWRGLLLGEREFRSSWSRKQWGPNHPLASQILQGPSDCGCGMWKWRCPDSGCYGFRLTSLKSQIQVYVNLNSAFDNLFSVLLIIHDYERLSGGITLESFIFDQSQFSWNINYIQVCWGVILWICFCVKWRTTLKHFLLGIYNFLEGKHDIFINWAPTNLHFKACLHINVSTSTMYLLGAVYSWGDGDYGKLGRGGNDGCKTPKVIEKLMGQDVVRVYCGNQFSMALTKSGAVYTWWVSEIS